MLRFIFICFTALVLSACSGSDSFIVSAEIENLGLEAIYLSYVNDNGEYLTVEGRAKKPGAKVKLKGSSDTYTLVRLSRADGEVIALFPAKNGEKIKVSASIARTEAAQVSGSTECDSLSQFIHRTANLDPAATDAAIAKFIKENPSMVTSAVLLVSRFNASQLPARADSLFAMLTPEAKPRGIVEGWAEQLSLVNPEDLERRVAPITVYGRGDSTLTIAAVSSPYTIIAFTRGTERPDSLSRELQKFRKSVSKKRVNIVEVSIGVDSAAWNRAAVRDTAMWRTGWVPGGAASPALRRMKIARTPFFIVADSTATQLYRGSSITGALRALPAQP